MRTSWAGSMQSALVATLSRPDWWAMGLAAFLIRGGFMVILLPVVSLPSTAALITALAPTVERVVLGRPSLEGVLVGALVIGAAAAGLAIAGAVGSWLDLRLAREAASSDELDLPSPPSDGSPWQALGLRLVAHIPTLIVLGFGIVRVADVGYQEFTAPGETGGAPVVARVLARVPEVVVLLIATWLMGETAGSLAARRAAAGATATTALRAAVRQVLAPRGLATLGLTSVVLLGLIVTFGLAAARTWEHLRAYLLDDADLVPLAAALILFVGTWVLGLAIVGAGLAWRATAWTAEAGQG